MQIFTRRGKIYCLGHGPPCATAQSKKMLQEQKFRRHLAADSAKVGFGIHDSNWIPPPLHFTEIYTWSTFSRSNNEQWQLTVVIRGSLPTVHMESSFNMMRAGWLAQLLGRYTIKYVGMLELRFGSINYSSTEDIRELALKLKKDLQNADLLEFVGWPRNRLPKKLALISFWSPAFVTHGFVAYRLLCVSQFLHVNASRCRMCGTSRLTWGLVCYGVWMDALKQPLVLVESPKLLLNSMWSNWQVISTHIALHHGAVEPCVPDLGARPRRPRHAHRSWIYRPRLLLKPPRPLPI
jgi:hypothetical protein